MISLSDCLTLADEGDPHAVIELAARNFLHLTSFSGIIVTTSSGVRLPHDVVFAEGYPEDCLDHVRRDFVLQDRPYRHLAASSSPVSWDEGDFRDSDEARTWLLPAGYRNGCSLSLRTPDGQEVGSIHVNARSSRLDAGDRRDLTTLGSFISTRMLTGARLRSLRLTAREHTVVTYLADGASNRQIAEALFVSARTVATHVEHILKKFEVTTRVEVAVMAVRLGIV